MLYASISVSKKYSLYPKNIIAYAVKTNLIFAMQPGCEQGSKAFLGGDRSNFKANSSLKLNKIYLIIKRTQLKCVSDYLQVYMIVQIRHKNC